MNGVVGRRCLVGKDWRVTWQWTLNRIPVSSLQDQVAISFLRLHLNVLICKQSTEYGQSMTAGPEIVDARRSWRMELPPKSVPSCDPSLACGYYLFRVSELASTLT